MSEGFGLHAVFMKLPKAMNISVPLHLIELAPNVCRLSKRSEGWTHSSKRPTVKMGSKSSIFTKHGSIEDPEEYLNVDE